MEEFKPITTRSLEEYRTQVLFYLSCIGCIAFASAFFLNRPPGTLGVFHRYIFSLNGFAVFILGLLTHFKPQKTRIWSWAFFVLTSLYILTHLNFLLLGDVGLLDRRIWMFPLLPWLVTPTLLAFTFFDGKTALKSAGAFLILVIASVLYYLFTRGPGLDLQFYNDYIQAFILSQLGTFVLLAVVSKVLEIALDSRLRNIMLQQIAFTDVLTGGANRRYLTMLIASELTRFKRSSENFAVVLIDIDNFKAINKSHGRAEGDKVLVAFSKILQSSLRSTDWCGRWGGEEFLVIFTSCPENGFESATERLSSTIASCWKQSPYKVTASFGIALAKATDNSDALIERSYRAVEIAKKSGKNRIAMVAE